MSDTTSHSNGNGNARFWQINIGHVLSMIVTAFSIGMAYQSVGSRLDNQDRQLVNHQATLIRLEGDVSAMQITESAAAQDRVDLHKTIEADFSRRLTKLEDKIESHR